MAEDKPNDEDLRHDDLEYTPAAQPKGSAKAWLNILEESEDAYKNWNDHCDKIDKLYASLDRLTGLARDKQFQMFWANMEVIKPSIYAKPPIPVVVPKFKDRRPVPQQSSEIIERCCIVAFDLARIDDIMILVRDDLALNGRGVPWCRYEEKDDDADTYHSHEKVCLEFKNRRDFLHSISRNWTEVWWVAGASYLTRTQARKRFHDSSGDEYQKAEYSVDKESRSVGGADNRERAKFWEIWDKNSERVIWVAKGCEDILDEDDPHLDLQNYFPCPKPAYGTTQRGSLVPVPDALQYQDQLDEINTLTGRIHALSDALEVKGFYPAGGAELSDAIQAAIKIKTPGRVLVPISNWAAFGGSKEVIIWLPIDMIAQTITALVALRKQVIDDIYAITGLSDIMRGETDPNETLGAQELKTDYGSVRVRDKQREMVRVARDMVEITAEIITETFKPETIIAMSQTQLPTQDLIRKQIEKIQQQMQQQQQQAQMLMQSPQIQQMGQQNPQAAQQAMQQFQQVQEGANHAIQKLAQKPTIEQVLQFIKGSRTKSFVLDIETDSTIQQDENAEKKRRGEFISVLGPLLQQLSMMITAEPQTASFCGELLKFAVAPYRAGRTLDGAIDDLVQQMEQKGQQPQQDNNPAQINAKTALQIENMKQQAAMTKNQQDGALEAAKMKQADDHKQMELSTQIQIAQSKQQGTIQSDQAKIAVQNQKAMESREAHQADMAGKAQEMEIARFKASADMQKAIDQRAQNAEKAQHASAAAALKLQNGFGPNGSGGH
jgi:hypothetical protein